jgi:nitrite reductase/ring-hydroxylating ferredoxin subunit
MSEVEIGRADQFPDDSVVVVTVNDVSIGIFRDRGALFAYKNTCLHQGGPVCEGMRSRNVVDVLAADRTLVGQRFGDDTHIVCPWHGYEYKLATGECVGDPKLRLRRYDVQERDGHVYITI